MAGADPTFRAARAVLLALAMAAAVLLPTSIARAATAPAVVTAREAGPAAPRRSTVPIPFLAGDAPLGPLAAAFGFRMRREMTAARVRLVVTRGEARHVVVISPGLSRALVDGRGIPLLDPPRYSAGILVVPPDLADLLRRLGDPPASAGRPYRPRRGPGEVPKAASSGPSSEAASSTAAAVNPQSAASREFPTRTVGGRVFLENTFRTAYGVPALSGPALALLGAGARERDDDGPGGKEEDKDDRKGGGKDEKDKPPPEGSAGFIVLDPGHGGVDEGSRGPGGTREKVVVLDIARRTVPHLRRKGVRVVLTRTDDSYVSLERRAEIANSLKPDAFLSLHVNSFRNESVSGVETWVLERELAPSEKTADTSRTLARAVQRSLVRTMRERDRSVRDGTYTVLRLSEVPAALTEMGFLSNSKTEKKLADAKQRERIAAALAKAVLDSGVLVARKK